MISQIIKMTFLSGGHFSNLEEGSGRFPTSTFAASRNVTIWPQTPVKTRKTCLDRMGELADLKALIFSVVYSA